MAKLLKAGEKYRYKKGEHLIRTKEHGLHISEAKKGIRTSPATEVKKGQHLSKETEFKEGHFAFNDFVSKWEYVVRNQLKDRGIEFQAQAKLLGTPDIYIPAFNLVIFIDGCFFHNCPICKLVPDKNTPLIRRIKERRQKDIEITKKLEEQGYTVLRIWEHDIKKKDFNIDDYIKKVYV